MSSSGSDELSYDEGGDKEDVFSPGNGGGEPNSSAKKTSLGEKQKKLYCICQKEFKEGILMIQCDGECEGWYHPNCMDLTNDEAQVLSNNGEPWYCTICKFRM
mmetsp:Transcript_31907/g.31175  ORF Transcript_31907/g.31175 Transcript_31907/m.31175 type:complete len:103 (+) Transcript_31907:607-915(+)